VAADVCTPAALRAAPPAQPNPLHMNRERLRRQSGCLSTSELLIASDRFLTELAYPLELPHFACRLTEETSL
jgi:hypothetical protein